jgi:hypothetical protein
MMTTQGAASRYARFLGLAVAIVTVLCAAGIVPTRRLAGPDGVTAMFTGCAIGLMSAALAGLLLVAVAAETPEARMTRSFLAMVARFGVVVAFGAGAVFSGMFRTDPLLLWVAFTYMALLPLEVRLAIYG